MSRVIVVGAGVVGLSCAVRLLEAGHRVDVVARDLPLETTSAVAAALVHPYRAGPADLVERWTARSTEVLDGPRRAGRRRRARRAGARRAPTSSAARVDALRSSTCRVYLRLADARRSRRSAARSPGSTSARCPTTATWWSTAPGLGARLLGADRIGRAGRRARWSCVEQVGLDRWWLDGGRGPDLRRAARATRSSSAAPADEGEWSRTPSPEVAADILRRASALVPALADARVLRHKVGLRPARPDVRLERVGRVVHCYGHGGAGVTLSWGCADDVAALADPRTSATPTATRVEVGSVAARSTGSPDSDGVAGALGRRRAAACTGRGVGRRTPCRRPGRRPGSARC